RLAQLIQRLWRPEAQHHRHSAAGPPALDDAHRLLDATLLVWADRETEVARFERLPVGREHHLPACERHPLDADQDLHALTRRFSGSNRGVEPATASETG